MINVSRTRMILSYIGCIVAILLPILLYFFDGSVRKSLSQYVSNPETYWIFKVSLAIISMAFLTKVKYIPATILLWLILLLDCTLYPLSHNISAGLFFIFMTFMMLLEKSFKLVIVMFFCLIILIYSLFWFEICGIILISLHQLKMLKRIENIQ